MVLKYTRYLLRSNWQLFLLTSGLAIFLNLTMPLWSRLPVLVSITGLLSTLLSYFLLYWPGYIYYRSLYGNEAALVHQIPTRGRTFLKAHLIYALLPYYVYMLLAPTGTVNFLARPEVLAQTNVVFQYSQSLNPLMSDAPNFAEFFRKIRDMILSTPPVFIAFLLANIVMPLSSYLMLFAAISIGNRLAAGKNRLLSVILTYLGLLFATFVVLGVSIGGGTVLITLNDIVGAEALPSGPPADFTEIFHIPFIQHIFIFGGVMVGIWTVISILIYYFTCRHFLEKKLNILS